MASMPFSTTDWLNITAAPVVGQQMWWVCPSESDSAMKMHIVTVTASSDKGSVITFDSGDILEVHETFQTAITIHNDIVAKSRGELDPPDVHMATENARDGNAPPLTGKEANVSSTACNNIPHQPASN